MIDFSQSGEQRHILDYFAPQTRDGRKIFWLSIGENDGTTFSNVRALALLGNPGIAVEPAPTAFAKLSDLYAGSELVICVNAAITDKDGPITLWDSGSHLGKGDTSLLSTTHEAELERWRKSGEKFTKIEARGITFATLVVETGLTRADFITIDAEGADYAILRQIDLRAVGCQMLCVESNSKDDKRFIDYAEFHGMKLHHKNHENLIFARK